MFTTLTARTRALRGCERILITDSVGFIEGLPPWMVEAFKAVLEEIHSSDLVLLMVDGSDPMSEILRKLKVSLEILSQKELRILILLNKMDLLSPSELEEKMEVLGRLPLPVLPISAKEGRNLDLLVEEIRKEVFGNRKELQARAD
jgi:GTP-binding protein HflX